MRNISSTFRKAAVAVSALALFTGVTLAVAAPAGATTSAGVSNSVVAKKVAKPNLRYTHVDIKSGGPQVQEFTFRFEGKWKGPVTITVYAPGVDAQVLENVKSGQTVSVTVAPEGAGFGCSIGTFEARDTAGNLSVKYFGAHYNT